MIALLKKTKKTKQNKTKNKTQRRFANQVERNFETHFREFVESVEGLEEGYQLCFADVKVGTH